MSNVNTQGNAEDDLSNNSDTEQVECLQYKILPKSRKTTN